MSHPLFFCIKQKPLPILTAEVIFLSRYYEKKKRSKKERVGFYTALSLCMVAVGMAAYSTYANYQEGGAYNPRTTEVDVEVTGVTEPETEPTESETEFETETTEPVTETEEYADETYPAETKTALETMLTVKEPLSCPLDTFKVVSEYSEDAVYNKTLNQWNAHTGVDLGCKKGDKVYSMGEGEVVKIYDDDLLGNTVVVKSNDYTAYYSGLDDNVAVTRGKKISVGDTIGSAKGVPSEKHEDTHIHIAVRVDGQYIDPLELMGSGE